MTGEHRIIVEKRVVRYELVIRHKLNIIRGESGSGKSLLESMVYENNMGVGSTKIRSDLKPRAVRFITDIKTGIKEGFNLFIFDETVFKKLTSGDSGETVAELVKDKPVYCIFITRECGKTCLPVDVEACYEIVEEKFTSRTIRRNEQLYEWKNDTRVLPTKMFTEDSKVWYSLFKNTLPNTEVVKLGGTGEITKFGKYVKKYVGEGDISYLVADGCAFGFLMPYFMEERRVAEKYGYKIRLFLPASFEYMLLSCGIVPNVSIDRLINAYSYSRIEKYMSLEKYYEDYLSEVTSGKLSKNSKALENYILRPRCVDKIYEYIKEIER